MLKLIFLTTLLALSACAKAAEKAGPSACQRQLELCRIDLQVCRSSGGEQR